MLAGVLAEMDSKVLLPRPLSMTKNFKWRAHASGLLFFFLMNDIRSTSALSYFCISVPKLRR